MIESCLNSNRWRARVPARGKMNKQWSTDSSPRVGMDFHGCRLVTKVVKVGCGIKWLVDEEGRHGFPVDYDTGHEAS